MADCFCAPDLLQRSTMFRYSASFLEFRQTSLTCQHALNSQGASMDEEYVRTVLAAMGYANSAAAREVWEGPVKRSFDRRPKGLIRLQRCILFLIILVSRATIHGRSTFP